MTIVYEKKQDEIQCNASTTKLMTALVCFDSVADLSTVVTAAEADTVGSNETRMQLQTSDQLSYLDLLHGLMMQSANDAAKCIARNASGSVAAFVTAMNAKAVSLGMTNTHFDDPSGVSYLTRSTAHDLQILMQAYALNPLLVSISATMDKTVTTRNSSRNIVLEHTVKPFISRFPELICAKTGTVTFGSGYEQYNSGGCIAALWKLQNGQKRISIILGSGVGTNDRYDDLRALMDFEIARSKL